MEPEHPASGWTLVARWLLFVLMLLSPGLARALPSFAEQTGQPCAACHVGAFGPQLTQYGRDFKLNGYVASTGSGFKLPISVMTQLGFTHTQADQPGGAAPDFAPNNNASLDEVSVYYAGRIVPWLGAFVQLTYDGVSKQLHIDNADIRSARDTDLFEQDLVYGFTANNNPTVSDLWNSTPAWGFPYVSSKLAPTPLAATQIDGTLQERVAGGGAYAMWNDLAYLETDLYGGLGYNALNATGIVPVANTDQYSGVIPYWRLALQQQFGRSYAELGTYGLQVHVLPGGISLPGLTDQFTDIAVDANYQFTFDPKSVTSDMISAHATFIHEDAQLNASAAISGARPVHALNTARADVSYAIGATVTPSVQLFQTTGTADPNYWPTPGGRVNSSGMIAEIAYVPWGKPDSFISWGNLRLAIQYINYFSFNGTSNGASANNTLLFSVWAAAHF